MIASLGTVQWEYKYGTHITMRREVAGCQSAAPNLTFVHAIVPPPSIISINVSSRNGMNALGTHARSVTDLIQGYAVASRVNESPSEYGVPSCKDKCSSVGFENKNWNNAGTEEYFNVHRMSSLTSEGRVRVGFM
jgi:hypothetical protein